MVILFFSFEVKSVKNIFFTLACVVEFINLAYFGVTCQVLEVSVAQISADDREI